MLLMLHGFKIIEVLSGNGERDQVSCKRTIHIYALFPDGLLHMPLGWPIFAISYS